MSDLPKYSYQVFAYKIQIDESLISAPTWFASFACSEEAWNYVYWAEVEYENKYHTFYVHTSVELQ